MKRSQINIDRMRKQQGKASVGSMVKYGALAFGVTALLNGCDSEDARVYNNVDECEDDNPIDQAQCQPAYQKALSSWHQEAPRYRRQGDCEYDFGTDTCMSLSQSYIPRMSGFMLPNNGSDSDLDLDFDRPRGLARSKQYYSPAFRKWTTADGAVLGNDYSRSLSVSDSSFKPLKGSSAVLGRGGFGRTVSASRSSSSWGS